MLVTHVVHSLAVGGLENGLTGSTDGYRHDYVNLTPYAGTTIQLRLRYATDAAFEELSAVSASA